MSLKKNIPIYCLTLCLAMAGLQPIARADGPNDADPTDAPSNPRIIHGKDRVIVKNTRVDFDDVDVTGEIKKPDGAYEVSMPSGRCSQIIKDNPAIDTKEWFKQCFCSVEAHTYKNKKGKDWFDQKGYDEANRTICDNMENKEAKQELNPEEFVFNAPTKSDTPAGAIEKMLTADPRKEDEEKTKLHVCFAVDASGSMQSNVDEIIRSADTYRRELTAKYPDGIEASLVVFGINVPGVECTTTGYNNVSPSSRQAQLVETRMTRRPLDDVLSRFNTIVSDGCAEPDGLAMHHCNLVHQQVPKSPKQKLLTVLIGDELVQEVPGTIPLQDSITEAKQIGAEVRVYDPGRKEIYYPTFSFPPDLAGAKIPVLYPPRIPHLDRSHQTRRITLPQLHDRKSLIATSSSGQFVLFYDAPHDLSILMNQADGKARVVGYSRLPDDIQVAEGGRTLYEIRGGSIVKYTAPEKMSGRAFFSIQTLQLPGNIPPLSSLTLDLTENKGYRLKESNDLAATWSVVDLLTGAEQDVKLAHPEVKLLSIQSTEAHSVPKALILTENENRIFTVETFKLRTMGSVILPPELPSVFVTPPQGAYLKYVPDQIQILDHVKSLFATGGRVDASSVSAVYDTVIEWKKTGNEWTRAGYWINSSDPIVSTRYLSTEGWLISSFLSGTQKMFDVGVSSEALAPTPVLKGSEK